MAEQKLRAIDLYSGVGGWSFGLSLADVDVVASYEWWAIANRTNELNNGHTTHTTDIRSLELNSLPSEIDLVVGSPPCTEFSYSNRGGGGDVRDGLRDIIKFLTIVDHLKPRFWVMENVPRVAAIIEKELGKRGRLARFRHLNMNIAVFNLEDFGLPQRRKRCFVGNLDFEYLRSVSASLPKRTLGDVVRALREDLIVDPLYGVALTPDQLTDHISEPHLDDEERRINQANKTAHPIYNAMPFPDPLGRSVRTITATCTRVSRESVVIDDPECPGHFRRLTVRERSCLQGFPITYQFHGESHGAKLRMVGNAVPPPFSFYVAHSVLGTKLESLPKLTDVGTRLQLPRELAKPTRVEKPAKQFPLTRTFKFAVPNLRLKSGVRFELVNVANGGDVAWRIRFFFGTSKDICGIALEDIEPEQLVCNLPVLAAKAVRSEVQRLQAYLASADIRRMQGVWSHRGPGGTRPFELLDTLGAAGASIISALEDVRVVSIDTIDTALHSQYGPEAHTLPGVAKLHRNAPLIHAGLIVGAAANLAFANVSARSRNPEAALVGGNSPASPAIVNALRR